MNANVEDRRLRLQADLDRKKTQQERNRLGQFATPTALALDILRQAKALLPPAEPIRFLDPAIGTGSFYSAVLATFPTERIAAAEGFEIDEHYAGPCLELWRNSVLKLHLADFTRIAPPPEPEKFNLIICNPPYVRHHHLAAAEKGRLQTTSARACGVRIGGLAGLYCYFVALSHPWMADGSLAAWLIPSEFMDVNYGRYLKRYLLSRVTLLRIHRFDPNDVQFGDALVSSVVVWFRKEKPPANHFVEFTFGSSLTEPHLRRVVSATDLQREAKWTRFPASDVRERSQSFRLADFFSIKRGLATGCNDFFILTREQIEHLDLPVQFFKPILPSPRHLKGDEVFADDEGVPLVDQPLFLLDCRLPEEDLKTKYPALWSYLQTGKPGISERYLCKARAPWYSQEERPPSPFVCTYMGRSDKKNGAPFRFILNHSRATAANVYLILYPKPALAQAILQDQRLTRKVWEILKSIAPHFMLAEGRVYGGGLHKMEPRELGTLSGEAIVAILSSAWPLAGQRELPLRNSM